MPRRAIASVMLAGLAWIGLSHAAGPVERLRVGVVQLSLAPELDGNRDRMVAWISKAAARGARAVVFPEGALGGHPGSPGDDVEGAVRAIRAAARAHRVYVLFGGNTYNQRVRKNANWMKAIGPDGAELVHYEKLWDVHDAPGSRIFAIDGVPASSIICADRWLRGVEDLPAIEGARISFELSNNFDSEWVPDLEWYWYVPRAMRNNVFVIFANTANHTHGKPEPRVELRPRHGHTAVIAPDGSLVAAARDDLETLIMADLDLAAATRAEARARLAHPVIGRFWQAGVDAAHGRRSIDVGLEQRNSAGAEITLSQIWDDLSAPEETRAEVRDLQRPDHRGVAVFSPFSANLVVEAKDAPEMIVATRRVTGRNPHYPTRTARYHPAMAPWYAFGGELMLGRIPE